MSVSNRVTGKHGKRESAAISIWEKSLACIRIHPDRDTETSSVARQSLIPFL